MNLIKRKLAESMERMGRSALAKLDQESSAVKALMKMDRDGLLREDIHRFCKEMSTLEAGGVLKRHAQSVMSGAANGRQHQEAMQSIARRVIGRVEKKGGSLNLPLEYRSLLLEG